MDHNTINQEGCERTYKEEICANVQKIYDTCKDKDCLADMRVYFSPEGQMMVDNAISIRAKNSKIAFAKVELDPVPFNRGYYSVNIHYYFLTDFEVYTGNGRPQLISGVSSFEKKVILFGGEGNTMTFASDYVCNRGANGGTFNGPVAQVEVVEPIVLGSKLVNAHSNCCCCCETDIQSLPDMVTGCCGHELCDNGEKFALVSLGLFSVVRIVRDIQALIPSARFCLPENRCQSPSEEEPCTFFEKLSFPTGEFFPHDNGSDGCGCC